MKPTPLILITLGLATGVSIAMTYALRPPAEPAPQESQVSPEELASLRAQVQTLNAEVERLRAAADDAALPEAAGAERVDLDRIERAVARYFEERYGGMEPGAGAQPQEAAAPAAKADVRELLARLDDEFLDEDDGEKVWKAIREAGLLDEAIDLLEARADQYSDDPDAQVEVAAAYIQKIFEAGEGPEAGQWAGKADQAYDRALALDDRHWKARFNKAVSLSFWPPIYGKQGEAISHFETLLEQQKGVPAESGFDQTYLLLGNLYVQSGDSDKAQAIWKDGLALFPDSEGLQGKLEDL